MKKPSLKTLPAASPAIPAIWLIIKLRSFWMRYSSEKWSPEDKAFWKGYNKAIADISNSVERKSRSLKTKQVRRA